jgi:1,2-diacylglycerol 3-alpha-glucosyltransferase
MSTNEKLRIAFVADTVNGRIGGGVTSAHHVVEKLREDHEVLLVGVDVEGPGRVSGFTIPFTGQREMGFVLAWPNRRRLEHLFQDVDIVHLQFPFLLARSALLAARNLGRPVAAAFHVQPENALFNVGLRGRWLNDQVYRWWVRGLYNRVDAVIVPTAFAERKLRSHGLTTPVTIVSNGIPPDLAQLPDGARVPAEPRRPGLFRIFMAGRLAAEKHQELLLQALRLSKHEPRIELVIAGSGPRLHRLTRIARGLTNPAEIGFVTRERLIALLRASDLFVHCSEVELEGISVLEAMSVGLPVLVAQGSESAASELALDERFRFPVGDARALAAKIDTLVETPGILASARPLYRAAALRRDFGENVGKLAALYRSLVPRRAALQPQASSAA